MAYLKYYLYKKQISRDDGQTWSDVDPTELSPSGNPIGSYDTLGECESATPPGPPTPETDYFTLISKSSGYGGMSCTDGGTLSYSLNGGAWSSYSRNFSIAVSVGDEIRVKSTSKPRYKGDKYFMLNGRGEEDDVKYELYGNIMSLGYGDNFTGVTSLSEMFDAYSNLCGNNHSVVSAENLVLPATTLTSNCYDDMFSNCTLLTKAPALPATTLATGCYEYMFWGCTSLTTAPVLSATTMASGCCQCMFDGCSNLSNITCLATDISASSCTKNWVRGVAANGTFTKASSMSSWTTGNNGIPSGWTVQNT